jgi:hypothetical protein
VDNLAARPPARTPSHQDDRRPPDILRRRTTWDVPSSPGAINHWSCAHPVARSYRLDPTGATIGQFDTQFYNRLRSIAMARSRPARTVAVGVLSLIGSAVFAGSAQAAPAAAAECTTVPSATQPGMSIADPSCDFNGAAYTGNRFAPLTDAAGGPVSRVFSGILNGAAYRVEVPVNWNGDLVVWAHGFRGNGTTVWVDSTPLRVAHIVQGFAWAASSYQTNGYDVGHGVTDSHALLALARSLTHARPRDVYMTGASMGGHITGVEIERFRDFDGAMPICGVLGDKELFDYQTDANVTAAALTGAPIRFPATPAAGAAYAPTYAAQVTAELPQLGSGFTTGNPANVALTAKGRQWASFVQERSGGVRPGFDSAFAFWASRGFAPLTNAPFMFGLYPGTSGGTIGIADGNIVDNSRTLYRLAGSRGRLSPVERQVNRDVLRVSATTRPSLGVDGIPKVSGDPRIPVLSLHDIGDLFVTFGMEQVYAARVAWHGQSRLLVQRAIRGVNHCDFTPTELTTAFGDLVNWVRQHRKPAGDDIRNPRVVAQPTFGCRFTDGTTPGAHPGFVGVACPVKK